MQGRRTIIGGGTNGRRHTQNTGLSLPLTCAPRVAEVALDHTAGLAVPAADPAPVLLGRRPDDAVTADFLNDQRAGLSWVQDSGRGVVSKAALKCRLLHWAAGTVPGPTTLSEVREN